MATETFDNEQILEVEQSDDQASKMKLREAASQAYYEGNPIMTDDAFDLLVQELGVQDSEVGHGFVPDPDRKVQHKHRMRSLTKAYEREEIDAWFNKLPAGSEVLIQAKYDGAAIELVYAAGTGKLSGASTRGNGMVGEDVTPAALAMAEAGRIPAQLDVASGEEVHVYGEVLMGKKDFSSLLDISNAYTNRRASASGLMRRTNTEYARFLSFVAYDYAGLDDSGDINALENQGFLVPSQRFQVKASDSDGIWEALQLLNSERQDYDFLTDGAVIKLNADRKVRERVGASSTAPRWALAFKYPNTYRETTIRAVSWGVGRTGKLTPTAQFDTVDLGSNVSDATMHNHAQFIAWQFAPGDTFMITRAGEVIPYIGEVVSRSGNDKFEAPTHCPNCSEELFFSDTRSDLYCPQLGACALDLNIVYSLQTLGVKGVSHSLVNKLLDEGLISNFLDILNIADMEEKISWLPGEGQTSAAKAVDAIEVVWDQPLSTWIAAMGIRNISHGSAAILETHFSNLGEIAKAKDADFDLAEVEDFGPIKAQAVYAASDQFAEWHMRLLLEHEFSPEPYTVEVTESQFTDLAVLVTGSLPRAGRDEAKSWLVEHGAIIKGGISKNVDLVIVGENAGPAKLKRIEELGLKTMDGETFDTIMFGE